MWARRSHVLAPLASLTSKTTKWRWGVEEQKAFDEMKRIIAKETLLAYPDFSKPFEIHTDASHMQLGTVVLQGGKPIAFYSRKLNPAQTRYTTTERELLSIVETLKEFRNILLGHEIVVYTDHKNLTYKNFNTKRVMHWRLILEEFGLTLRYIKGTQNVVADALSHLEKENRVAHTLCSMDILSDAEYKKQYAEAPSEEFFAFDDEDHPESFPLTYAKIAAKQHDDAQLQKQYVTSDKFRKEDFRQGDKTVNLITREGKICVPRGLQRHAADWYYGLLMHPGEKRMQLTLGQHFYWKNMAKTVKSVCSRCAVCQLAKPKQQKLGIIPPKENAEIVPWETLCIDLIGPYTFGEGEKRITLHCLTMIDPATGWFEIVEIPNKRADYIANILEMTWLNRYPWPSTVIADRGREFMAEVKTLLRDQYGCLQKFITTRNPQANSFVERAHQTVHNMIRIKQIKDLDDLDQRDRWLGVLSAVGFAMRSTVHTTTQATPAQLVFNRDAIHNVGFQADWHYIKECKQRLIIQNNKKENMKRIPHEYKAGDLVMVLQDPNRKHGEDRYKGPYTVTQVFPDNGTATLQQTTPRGGVVSQTWNIRNLFPYKA